MLLKGFAKRRLLHMVETPQRADFLYVDDFLGINLYVNDIRW